MVDSCSSITAILSAASALDMEDGVESSFEVIMLRPVILENLLLHVVAVKVMVLCIDIQPQCDFFHYLLL